MSSTAPALARDLWRRFEPIHAVTYFSPECRDANRDVGLRGFWMGYFGARAAPLGAVPAEVVEATFFNFHPRMVRRAIPDAWSFAPVQRILYTRAAAAATALRRLVSDIDSAAARLRAPLAAAVAASPNPGRPLGSANKALPLPEDPVAALWQLCTTLREHRGDGHVAALTATGLDGLEAHVIATGSAEPNEQLLQNRGWTADEWRSAARRLSGRGLVTDGPLSPAGVALQAGIEATTDALAAAALSGLSDVEVGALRADLGAVAVQVIAAGDMPFPNPIGLDRFGDPLPG